MIGPGELMKRIADENAQTIATLMAGVESTLVEEFNGPPVTVDLYTLARGHPGPLRAAVLLAVRDQCQAAGWAVTIDHKQGRDGPSAMLTLAPQQADPRG